MNRESGLRALRSRSFDVAVIGGGATGLGCALDAALRGYATALIDAGDFAHATSSRSTKLIHGGVRYLQQGNIALVREALHERELLRANAPHMVRELPFFVPARGIASKLYYAAGLKVYDALARGTFPRSRIERGGVRYWDAQFDDARLAIALAQSAVDAGAAVANYVRADGFRYESGRIAAVRAVDEEGGEPFEIRARAVINAGGIFGDAIRRMDDPQAAPLLRFSRGSHLVISHEALPLGGDALLVPRTRDGRVLFAIPWHGHALVGTTDVAAERAEDEPRADAAEIDYLLQTLNEYAAQPVARADVRSVFSGLRPLVNRGASATANLSREHLIDVARSGLVTIAGGKWTTYRKMAQDTVDAARREGGLPDRPCRTQRHALHEVPAEPDLEYAARVEMARTVEDVLARRRRTLFTDAADACAQAPSAAAVLRRVLNRDEAWAAQQTRRFAQLARRYSAV